MKRIIKIITGLALAGIIFIAALSFIGCVSPVSPVEIKLEETGKALFSISLPVNNERSLVELQNEATDYELIFISKEENNQIKSFYAKEGTITGAIDTGIYDILLLAGKTIGPQEVKLFGSGFIKDKELSAGNNILLITLYPIEYDDVSIPETMYYTEKMSIEIAITKRLNNPILENYYPFLLTLHSGNNMSFNSNETVYSISKNTYFLKPATYGNYTISFSIRLKNIDSISSSWVLLPKAYYTFNLLNEQPPLNQKIDFFLEIEYGEAYVE
jgi:hypothetical protein